MLFFGDSRALYWPAPGVAGCRYVNRGIAGQTTEQARGRFDANVTPVSPRMMVLQAGINDLKAIPLLPWRRDQIVADCKANLHEIVKRVVDGGAIVVVSTVFPPGKVPLERKLEWSPDVEKAVEDVNAETAKESRGGERDHRGPPLAPLRCAIVLTVLRPMNAPA